MYLIKCCPYLLSDAIFRLVVYITVLWLRLNHLSLLLYQVHNGSSRPGNESTGGAEGPRLEDIKRQIRLWRWHLRLHHPPHVRQQAELADSTKLQPPWKHNPALTPPPFNSTSAVSLTPPLLLFLKCFRVDSDYPRAFWSEKGCLSRLFSPWSSSIRMISFCLAPLFFIEKKKRNCSRNRIIKRAVVERIDWCFFFF